MSEPTYVAETLAWCNERRAEQGKKPLKKLPKGKRRDPESCPCGEATGFVVLTTTYRAADQDCLAQGLRLPRSVTDFVVAFDNGDLPQYEATS